MYSEHHPTTWLRVKTEVTQSIRAPAWPGFGGKPGFLISILEGHVLTFARGHTRGRGDASWQEVTNFPQRPNRRWATCAPNNNTREVPRPPAPLPKKRRKPHLDFACLTMSPMLPSFLPPTVRFHTCYSLSLSPSLDPRTSRSHF